MTSTVAKWGNSLAIRIPKHLADRVNMQEGSCVELDVSDGFLIVKPLQREKYTLDELLDGMTPAHFHPEISTGKSVGNESAQFVESVSAEVLEEVLAKIGPLVT